LFGPAISNFTSPGAVSDGEPGETTLGTPQPSASKTSSKMEKPESRANATPIPRELTTRERSRAEIFRLRLGSTACTLSSLFCVLLRVAIKFLFAVFTAEIIALTLILRATRSTLLVNFHVAYGIAMSHCHDVFPPYSLHEFRQNHARMMSMQGVGRLTFVSPPPRHRGA
jgi:hypothetical protein